MNQQMKIPARLVRATQGLRSCDGRIQAFL
jgi:hypothetical protein